MSENTVLTIIAVIVGGCILATIVYYIARFMRGSIKLSLPRTSFNPGDTIAGSFELHTKKNIEGNQLIVSLIGMEEVRDHDDDDTDIEEIYRDEVVVEDAKLYPANSTAVYNFEILVPDMQSSEFLNSTASNVLTAAARLISNRSSRLKWNIEARLDAKGVDLAAGKSISINTNQLV